MQTVTIREAKAGLNALVEAAERGEQVVLMRGSKLVAAIVPVSADEVELGPRLSDPQAERFWRELEAQRKDGSTVVMESPEEAVAYLSAVRRPARRRTSSGVTRSSAGRGRR